MFSDKIQEKMIGIAVEKFKEWIVKDKKGLAIFNVSEVNKWLEDNKYDFKLEVYNLEMISVSYHGEKKGEVK